MMLISHRRNTVEQLQATPKEYGVEVDIRSNNGKLIMHHDPFVEGELFEDWLAQYRHQTLILNIKEEGLEAKLIELMKQYHIDDYFFLDQSFPFLVKWSRLGERHCAIRVSEFESLQTALSLAGQIDWVWVDCFSRFPLSGREAQQLQDAGFKLCLVSPELQSRPAETEVPELAALLKAEKIEPEAICTKVPELWKQHFSSHTSR